MEIRTEWDFGPLLKEDFSEKRKEIEKAYFSFRDKWKNNSEYLENAEVLKEALDEYENIQRNFFEGGDEFYYLWLKTQLDESNPQIRAEYNKSNEFRVNEYNEISFFTINISKVSSEKQKEFLECEKLKDYKHFLERVFAEGKYVLSEKEEKIINLKSSSAYSFWVNMLSGFLSKEEGIVFDENLNEVKKSFSEMRSLQDNTNPEIRRKASETFNKVVEKYEDVAENEINAILENKKINDKIRGYERPDKSRHIEDDIDSKVVDTLIESVSGRGFEISKRFYKMKANLFGLNKFDYSERNLEYGHMSKEFDYASSVNLIKKVFTDLDKIFGEIFDEFLKNGQIDVFPKKGKRDGAFCIIYGKNQPIYVMLNHTNKLKDVLTLAHEMGHAINDVFMKENLNALDIGSPKSVAEVASTFMEDFVLQELIKECSEEEKLVLLMQKIQDDVQTIMRQTACYNFEKELHEKFREKGYLSKKDVGKIFLENMKNYLGEIFEEGKSMEDGWIYWPHIREYFYVYSYASGLLISKAMQKMVREDKSSIDKIKEFLSAGTSESPKDIFMKMGIDITKKEFWENGLDEIEGLLNETEELARKLGKID